MNVTLPNGQIIEGVPDNATKDDIAQKAVSSGLANWNDFGGEPVGFIDSVKDVFTGESRETRATQDLPELPESGGFLSTADPMTVAKISPALITATEPQEIADILKANIPEIGIQYDEKGNIIAGNNKTGQKVVLNKPGISTMDIVNILGIGSISAPAGITGAAISAPIKAAQIAAQSGLTTAATEAAQSSVGGDFDLQNILIDTAAAGALEAIPAILKGYKARSAASADDLTKEAIDAEASRVGSQLSPEAQQAQQRELTQTLAEQSQAKRPDIKRIASEVSPDPKITQAAERLGVEEVLTPGQVSQSQTYRELEGALSAVPASQLSAQQKEAAQTVAQKADDLIIEFGGTTDKSALSESVKDEIISSIDDLDNQASQMYKEIDSFIPKKTQVDSSSIVNALEEEASNLGGIENLEPIQRRILKISESNPSYALLDKERKKVGQALRKAQGPYKDAETGTLKQLYRMLTESQEKTAQELGAGEMWGSAKKLVMQRKNLEDQSILLLGKDRAGAIMPKVGAAIKKLSSGDYRDFNNIIKSIPKERREEVVLSALNDVFTAGSRKEKQLSAPGFADWYENLNRNKTAKSLIMKNLPEAAAQRLDDIYQVARGMRQASAEKVRTGVIQGLLSDFDKADGMLSKLYQTGKTIAAAEGATSAAGLPGAGTTGVIVDALSKRKNDPITKSADALLSSREFQQAARAYADTSVRAKSKQAAADRAIQNSERYRKWLNALPNDEKRNVIRLGLMAYLGGGQEQQQEQR